LHSSISKFDAERAELDVILNSGMLGRANNLVRLLTFVCEKHFEGATAEIKEYNIAVQALGRPHDFDPQMDTIVRVTAHALRKRLDDYYRTAGAEHTVRICLPPGGYVPKFTHRNDVDSEPTRLKLDDGDETPPSNGGLHHEDSLPEFRPDQPIRPAIPILSMDSGNGKNTVASSLRNGRSRIRVFGAFTILAVAACVLFAFAWRWWSRTAKDRDLGRTRAAAVSINPAGSPVRALVGNSSSSYNDRAGSTWSSDRFCSGGDSFSIPGHLIQGTEDPGLFSAGRRGVFQCSYPVSPGTYEVHLLFAETSGFQEGSRNGQFSINGGPTVSFDVADDAAGDDIATTKVFTDVSPGADGLIHVNFITPESFLNAVEILPGIPHRMLPVRIVAGHYSYHDSKGNDWMRDRYYFGGRLSSFAGDLTNVPDGRLYEWHRFGHIHYIIPVATGEKYTLRLYFLERWFGLRNGGFGGVGSRVFDVSCNGSMLLKNFDIFREAGNGPLMKSFAHIEPTAQGKIELYFIPGVNYPSISAIEIIPE
jgi:Malectin domain